jgi:hypothetical protein
MFCVRLISLVHRNLRFVSNPSLSRYYICLRKNVIPSIVRTIRFKNITISIRRYSYFTSFQMIFHVKNKNQTLKEGDEFFSEIVVDSGSMHQSGLVYYRKDNFKRILHNTFLLSLLTCYVIRLWSGFLDLLGPFFVIHGL